MVEMADWVFWAGQALSVSGLTYGCFVALSYSDKATDARARVAINWRCCVNSRWISQ